MREPKGVFRQASTPAGNCWQKASVCFKMELIGTAAYHGVHWVDPSMGAYFPGVHGSQTSPVSEMYPAGLCTSQENSRQRCRCNDSDKVEVTRARC